MFPYCPFPSSQSFLACLFLSPLFVSPSFLHPANLTHPTPRHARVSQGSQFPLLLSDQATACEKKFAWEGNTNLHYRREKKMRTPTTTKFLLLDFIFIFSRQILIHESYKIERAEHQNKILYTFVQLHISTKENPTAQYSFWGTSKLHYGIFFFKNKIKIIYLEKLANFLLKKLNRIYSSRAKLSKKFPIFWLEKNPQNLSKNTLLGVWNPGV